jgi:hypothetical protein
MMFMKMANFRETIEITKGSDILFHYTLAPQPRSVGTTTK